MPSQNNFIRPSSAYSASSTMKLDNTLQSKTSAVILTLISIIFFLFVLCKFNDEILFKFISNL